jgi:dienelactone hydrolase
MPHAYEHLGIFSDLVDAARQQGPLFPHAAPGPETQRRIREVLGFCDGPELPQAVHAGDRWERDGVAGEVVSWSVGYGPRTEAWLLKPAGASGRLPGMVALHDHGGFKFYGKEKIATGPNPLPEMSAYHARYYGGRAYANALARAGFVVLVHDTFLWGSRRFPVETMPQSIRDLVAASESHWHTDPALPRDIAGYNAAAGHHEHVIEKYCTLLGTSMAGVVSHEDRVALNYLCSRPDVDADRVGCIGLSGGGNRAALLLATHERIAAAVIVGLMSTYEELLDHNVATHTWMLFPPGWARYGDWPDLAACRAPLPLLVQYDAEDDLFTPEGMRAAHERISAHYRDVGHADAYTGQFYPGPHKFDLAMQQAAFGWLAQQLQAQ